MPLVVEHTIYSIVNVLRPTVWTNQNNFVQLLCNQFSCCVCCNLPTWSPVTPSQQSPAQAIQEPTAQPAQLLYSLLITFYVTTPYALAAHVLPLISFLTLHCLALQQHWLQARPSSASYLAFWTISFHMPKFTTCKTFNLTCISLLQLLLWLWKSLHTSIPERSKHNISQVHRYSQSYLHHLKCLHHQYIFSRTHGLVWLLA